MENICSRSTDGVREKPMQQTSSPLRDQRASSHERLSDVSSPRYIDPAEVELIIFDTNFLRLPLCSQISSRCSSGKGYMVSRVYLLREIA